MKMAELTFAEESDSRRKAKELLEWQSGVEIGWISSKINAYFPPFPTFSRY